MPEDVTCIGISQTGANNCLVSTDPELKIADFTTPATKIIYGVIGFIPSGVKNTINCQTPLLKDSVVYLISAGAGGIILYFAETFQL